jgi:hypothetical protein
MLMSDQVHDKITKKKQTRPHSSQHIAKIKEGNARSRNRYGWKYRDDPADWSMATLTTEPWRAVRARLSQQKPALPATLTSKP